MSTVLNTNFLTASEGNTTIISAPYSIPNPTTPQGIANKAYVDYRSYGTYRSTGGSLNCGVNGSAFTSPSGFLVNYQITGMGNYVTLQIAAVPRTLASTTSTFVRGSYLPASYCPVRTVTAPCQLYYGVNSVANGEISVDASGSVTIRHLLMSGTTFTAGVLAGFPGLRISYIQA